MNRTTKGVAALSITAIAAVGGIVLNSTNAFADSSWGSWSGVAQCESGGNPGTNTGNGFYGGLQFTQQTWNAYGGSGNPANASVSEQIRIANRVKAGQGLGAWPNCGKHYGGGSSSPTYKKTYTAPKQSYSAPKTERTYKTPSVPRTTHYSADANVTVQAGDTLSGIASKYGKSWKSVYNANANVIGSNPNLIFPGEKLIVK